MFHAHSKTDWISLKNPRITRSGNLLAREWEWRFGDENPRSIEDFADQIIWSEKTIQQLAVPERLSFGRRFDAVDGLNRTQIVQSNTMWAKNAFKIQRKTYKLKLGWFKIEWKKKVIDIDLEILIIILDFFKFNN